jgi:hypothetical protein
MVLVATNNRRKTYGNRAYIFGIPSHFLKDQARML